MSWTFLLYICYSINVQRRNKVLKVTDIKSLEDIAKKVRMNIIEEVYGASVMSLIKGCMTPIKIVSTDKRKEVFDSEL